MSNSVYILLDRSQSMISSWEETLGSINGYVENLPGKTNVVLATFDTLSYETIRNLEARNWKNITSEEVRPRGSTPLYDSAARMMWRILDEKPERAIFVVMTDGEENDSKHFKQPDVKKLTSTLESLKYEVLFLGANFDKIGSVATQFGLASTKWANMTPRNYTETLRGAVATSSSEYLSVGRSINFSEELKAKAIS